MKYLMRLGLLVSVAVAAAAQTDTVVANAFPASLVIPDGLRQYGYATGSINGESVIAAAYSNGQFGAVVMLTPAGTRITGIAPDNFLGIRPEVSLTDIDGDGQPEVVVIMNQPRGLPATWIYRFANDTLTLLGPLRDGAELPETDLADVQFLRTDATTRLALLDYHSARWSDDDGTEHTSETRTLYSWNGSGFGAGQRVDLIATAQRDSGAPQPVTATFVVRATPATRTLLLINGDADGTHRASSVSVMLNDKEVIGDRDLNQTIASVRVPIALNQLTNQLTMTMKSDPGAQIMVLVLP